MLDGTRTYLDITGGFAIASARRMNRRPSSTSIAPSASYSLTVRLEIRNRPGMLGRVTSAIGQAGGDIGAVDLVEMSGERVLRDITIKASDSEHGQQIIDSLRKLAGVRVANISDRTFLMHLGGKIEIKSKVPIRTRDDLSMAYTPGVARVCLAIKAEPSRAFTLTMKHNAVAVVTDGTAVLGLGDIGPEAALPVMEGKAMLFKELAGVDAFPLCLATKDPDRIVEAVKMVAPAFGGINLEDIAAPRCFEVEERLRKELDIPVFHDDQHGTAVVVLAALVNALKIVKKDLRRLRVVVSGVGAAGTATVKILLAVGVRDIVGIDEHGTIHRGRTAGMDFMKRWVAEATNPRHVVGRMADAVKGADVFIGLSVPGVLTAREVRTMARDRIVFAMANPVPEIQPEEIERSVAVLATGRSDYPNQINNVLCFPGFFRGLLDSRARAINDEMKIAAARAIASCVGRGELGPEYIIPSVFNKAVAPAVAREVVRAAQRTGVARRRRSVEEPHWT
jgi:malate dehydrogenase (oxaloacetate-decarboxylating)